MRLESIGPAALIVAACSGGGEPPLNVYLITLDTTRADRLGCYGHRGIDTPAADRLAAEGTRYDNAYTVVPITLPSHTSMMTGTYPVYHGVRENGGFYVPDEMETLAEILAGEGYDTAAFVGAFPLDSQTGLDQGFDLYDDNYPSSLEEGRHPALRRFYDERPAAEVARAAMGWLTGRGGGRPFFIWTHFFDPHQPLTPPSPYRERYRDAYDAEIASVDEAIGQILNQLETAGELERTLVILTADHGEGLGEHGEATHALLLYSSTLRVPLIVRDPTVPGGRTVRAPVATVDVFSTVLDRLGLEVPDVNQGIPLPASDAAADAEREIYSETMFGRLIYGWSPLQRLTAGERVLIRGPTVSLHDRSSDPGEAQDLGQGVPAAVEGLTRRLLRRKARLGEGGHTTQRPSANQESLARLAALGYLGAGAASPSAELSDAIDLERPDPREMMEVFDLHNEGQSLGAAGRHEVAVPILERARRRDPRNPSVVMALAHSHLALGQLDRGREILEELLQLSPEHLGTHLLLARYHRSRGELGLAVALTERAADLDPADHATRLLLAHLLEDAGLPSDAEEAYRKVLAGDAHHVLALNGLATLLYRRGESAGAVELLLAALQRQPFYTPAILNLGVIEHDRGNDRRALELAGRALELQPDHPQALELERRVLEALGSPSG